MHELGGNEISQELFPDTLSPCGPHWENKMYKLKRSISLCLQNLTILVPCRQ